MFKRILVAVDGSGPSLRGVAAGAALAADQRAELVLLHVIDDVSYLRGQNNAVTAAYADRYRKALEASGRKILDDAKSAVRARGVEAKTRLGTTGGHAVAQAIVEHAQRLRADVIVLGTHGRRGVRRLLLGSDAEAVLRQSRVPVLMVPEEESAARTVKSAQSASPPQKPAGKRKGRRILPSTLIESSQ